MKDEQNINQFDNLNQGGNNINPIDNIDAAQELRENNFQNKSLADAPLLPSE